MKIVVWDLFVIGNSLGLRDQLRFGDQTPTLKYYNLFRIAIILEKFSTNNLIFTAIFRKIF
ncbi:MAG: hypothetical protein F6K40_33545 [Okeania sp. SIO3I5]|uniref:hypothetical protein n=1 Tax=Okeania sp. SIO3I5 TaxID=2607805 RepID=UPI0013BCEE1D|nr:hypothetical protein [Okeania sp. SIO3I5]NEQ40879.1 hypothetical protein [Okeania sp. SIO3I5]